MSWGATTVETAQLAKLSINILIPVCAIFALSRRYNLWLVARPIRTLKAQGLADRQPSATGEQPSRRRLPHQPREADASRDCRDSTRARSTPCRSCCCAMPTPMARARPCGTRTSASGRPGRGRSCATRCALSPSACASSGSSAAMRSPSSATTARASMPASQRCRASAAFAVPVYQDSVADEMAYVLDHAEVKFAIVQNQEQVDKVISISDRLPKLAAHHLRGGARARRLRPSTPAFLRARAGARPRGDARQRRRRRLVARRDRQGQGRATSA